MAYRTTPGIKRMADATAYAQLVVRKSRGGLVVDPKPVSTLKFSTQNLKELQRECEEVATTRPGDTHQIASLMQQMSLHYYTDVRRQAQQSFLSALIAAVVGTLFFLLAAWYGMVKDEQAWVGIVAGALTQVIAAINFYLYGRAARQFATFHVCLERTNRYLLANTLCENLELPLRDQVRHELIQVVANAPMLTLDATEGGHAHKTAHEAERDALGTQKGSA